MNRRSFLKTSGAFSALALGTLSGPLALGAPAAPLAGMGHGMDRNNARILPPRLKKGDLIGLVTPGSPVTEEQLQEAVEKLEELGFSVYYRDTVRSQYGYFAGPDQERASELMHMFMNPEVRGIWSVRGGYGSIRILNLLDFEQIRMHPKVFIGYSDITALLTSVYERTGLVTFHGPMGVSEFNPFTLDSLMEVVMDPSRRYRYPYEREDDTDGNPEFDLYTIRDGRAEGALIGGNISVLDSMIGSRFEPDFSGKIVYLEEVDEKTYRVDKMLFHLLEATNLKEAAGMALGVFGACDVNDEPRLTLQQAIGDLLDPLQIPVSYGLSFGHINRMITLPNGIRARLNAGKNSLRLLEPAVS